MPAPSCKYCGEPGLYWVKDGHRGWRLYRSADGTRHRCQQFHIGRHVTAKRAYP